MSKIKKIVARFLRNPPDVAFEDVQTLLKAYGYSQARTRGSHHIFHNPNASSECKQIIVPTIHGRKVKREYVKQIIRFLNLDDLDDSGN